MNSLLESNVLNKETLKLLGLVLVINTVIICYLLYVSDIILEKSALHCLRICCYTVNIVVWS